MLEPNDWRLNAQINYLKGVTLAWRRYSAYREGWDHDHCAFCWAEFGESEQESALHQGYSTLDSYHWVCETCFQDFRSMFEWQVAESNAPGRDGSA